MAVVFATGFEAQQAATDNVSLTGGSLPSYSSAQYRTGGLSLLCIANSGIASYLTIPSPPSNAWYHFGIYIQTTPSVTRVIFGSSGSAINVRLNSDRTLSYYDAGTLLGTTTIALSAQEWHWLGIRVSSSSSDVVVLQVDGVDALTASPISYSSTSGRIGFTFSETSNASAYIDDVIIDNAGFLAPSKVDFALPISNNYRLNVTDANGIQDNDTWMGVDNTPPAGVASASESANPHASIKYPASQTESYVVNLETYTTLGIGASDTILGVQVVFRHGEDIATGTKNGTYVGMTNPDHSDSLAFTFGDDGGAHGAEAGLWKTVFRGYWPSPSVALGTSPTIQIDRASQSRVGCIDFMGLVVVWTPASSTPKSGTDSGTGADTAAELDAQEPGVEAGTGTETASTTAAITATPEAAAGADSVARVNVYATDAGVGADAPGQVAQAKAATDAGVGADTSYPPGYAPSCTDAGAGADTWAGTWLAASETGAGADTWAGTRSSGWVDAGTGADTSGLAYAPATNDAGVATDSSSLATLASATDTGVGADSSTPPAYAPLVSDAGAGTDTGSKSEGGGDQSLSVSDAGVGTDETSTSYTDVTVDPFSGTNGDPLIDRVVGRYRWAKVPNPAWARGTLGNYTVATIQGNAVRLDFYGVPSGTCRGTHILGWVDGDVSVAATEALVGDNAIDDPGVLVRATGINEGGYFYYAAYEPTNGNLGIWVNEGPDGEWNVDSVTVATGITNPRIRLDAVGSSPTTLRARVWPAAQAEPDTWDLETSDSYGPLQSTGGFVGITGWADDGAPIAWDDFEAVGTSTLPLRAADWRTETAAGADAIADRALTAAEAGTGAEAAAGLQVAVAEAGTGTDVAAVVAALAGTDAGVGADASNPPVGALATVDAGTGADTATVDTGVYQASGSDAGVATETSALGVASAAIDAGVGTDASAPPAYAPAVSDSGVGVDGNATTNTPISATEAGTGVDAALSPAYAPAVIEAGIGVETWTSIGSAGWSDAGVGADATPSIAFGATEAGTGAEVASPQAALAAAAEAGTGTDSATSSALAPTTDTGTGTDAPGTLVVVLDVRTDAGVGADVGTKSEGTTAVSATDAGVGADSASVPTGTVIVNDGSSGAGMDGWIVVYDRAYAVDDVISFRSIEVRDSAHAWDLVLGGAVGMAPDIWYPTHPIYARQLYGDLIERYGMVEGRRVYEAMERERKGPFAPGAKYGDAPPPAYPPTYPAASPRAAVRPRYVPPPIEPAKRN